jgi:crotonobetainyl-CoA:carnitine CoA-transferase CaiB-like acyl-CoA transferase
MSVRSPGVLADLGGDVAVSCRAVPHRQRSSPDGTSLWFAPHRQQRGITADLTTDEGRSRVLSLLADADVLIESGRPGELSSHGLDPMELTHRFGRLIVASVTPFGQTGPYAHDVATDDTVVALSGWLATSGIPTKPPLLVPGSLATDAASVITVFVLMRPPAWPHASGQH